MKLIILGIAIIAIYLYYKFVIKSSHKVDHAKSTILGCDVNSQNCVSSESKFENSKIKPIKYNGDNFHKDIKNIVLNNFNAKLVFASEDYMHFEIITPVMRYRDDLELKIERGLIKVSSRSRVGRSDLGANRARIERLRGLIEGK